jgi:diacylglycerol kinase family enzyme
MRRAVLIVNPFSTAVTQARVSAVEGVLRRHVELVTRMTEARGHAAEIAAEAADAHDAVIVFSGDGTYNEAINGSDGSIPFGFLPGGGTSVLSRALGLPRDPLAAAEQIGDALVENRTRRISLGRVNGRRFCFASGIGLDAELIRRVDDRGRRVDGRRAHNSAFITSLAGLLVGWRLRMAPRLEVVGHGPAAFVLVANGRPYTYAGPIPLVVNRAARFDDGLDFVAPRSVTPLGMPMMLLRAFRGTLGEMPGVIAGHDVPGLEVRCDEPMALQADGEDLGDVTRALFEAEPDAISVLV